MDLTTDLIALVLCIAVFCIGAALLCHAATSVFGKDWWLPRLLTNICKIPENRWDDDKEEHEDEY